MEPAASPNEECLKQALSYMQSAIELLDGLHAPADIGAHLDLAICRLQDWASQQTSSVTPAATGRATF